MAKTHVKDQSSLRKFGIRDSLAYAAGDFGCNMSFALKGTMIIFWTQFMKMDSVVYAALLLVCQVWDAINDPLLGSIIDADRHKYRRNKFLTYISFGSVGLMFAGALCFIPWIPKDQEILKGIAFICGYVIWAMSLSYHPTPQAQYPAWYRAFYFEKNLKKSQKPLDKSKIFGGEALCTMKFLGGFANEKQTRKNQKRSLHHHPQALRRPEARNS